MAPGFVGLYNDAVVLTELARDSAEAYETVGSGFARPGGIEIATSDVGAQELESRADAARDAGLTVAELVPRALPASVAGVVDERRIVAAWHCVDDGTAVPSVLTAALRRQASDDGARFVEQAHVRDVTSESGTTTVRTRDGEGFVADDVVLAGGVWGPTLAGLVGLDLPMIPVAHPYVYGPVRPGLVGGPFLRWPERHVYARVHDNRLGIGSYDHAPVPVAQDELDGGAGLAWSPEFDPVIAQAQTLLAVSARFEAERRINGVFAMTPDNLPFLGPHPRTPGIWVAQAIWVTHAAGAARALRRAMTGEASTPQELAVGRFAGRDQDELRARALRLYRDIYANEAPAAP